MKGPPGTADAPGALDLRVVPAALAAWAAAAWAVTAERAAVTVAVVLLAGVSGVAAAVGLRLGRQVRMRGGWQAVVVLAVAATTCVAALAGRVVRDAGVLPRLAMDAATVHLVGTVSSGPRRVRPDPARPWTSRSERWTVTLAGRSVRGRHLASSVRADVLVVGGSGWETVQRGSRLSVTGRLRQADPGADVVAVLSAAGPPLTVGTPTPGTRVLIGLRQGLVEASASLAPDARGLLPGLVVGDTRGVPPGLDAAMRTSGLTHLTAVSGGNTSLVTGAVLAVLAAAGVPRTVRLLVGTLALGAFAALAGGEASVLRAGVMGVIALVGLATSRPGAGVPALAVTVVACLLGDPWLARSTGFALSALATAGLLVLVPTWSAYLARMMPRPLALAVSVPLAAQVVCAPLIALVAGQVSLVAVPANLLAEPVVGPTTVLGLLATLVAPVWPPLAGVLARVAGLGAAWIALVARRCAAVPAAAVAWPVGWWGALALAGVTVMVGLMVGLVVGLSATRAPRRLVLRFRRAHRPRHQELDLGAARALPGVRLPRRRRGVHRRPGARA